MSANRLTQAQIAFEISKEFERGRMAGRAEAVQTAREFMKAPLAAAYLQGLRDFANFNIRSVGDPIPDRIRDVSYLVLTTDKTWDEIVGEYEIRTEGGPQMVLPLEVKEG